jgi:DNA recombination protein RmuC
MQQMSNDLLFLLAGILSGSLISWFIMKQRASVYKESTERQITRFEKEAVLMKDNITSKEKHINTLTASVSEKDADIRNLRIKIDEQKEDIERMNERLKNEFKNLAKEILNEKNRMSQTNGDFEIK